MPELPTGTVTFLFTDVAGSARLWERHPDAMRHALARHDGLIEDLVAQHHGVVVRPRGEGDSRFAVFARASDAVAAAAGVQVALHREPWPGEARLRVRMAVHTGEADLREGDYYGAAVNRCARLRAIAHGGQILVSQTTRYLVQGALAPEVALRDLGEHRLADLAQPERAYQVLAPGLPAEFAPLRSLDALPNNLPLQLTSFVGRERELAELRQALASTRLLTLIGAGGCGKTRLALHLAAEALDAHPDGVWCVELAPLGDPDLVPKAVAGALGLPEQPGVPVAETLAHSLQRKRALLLVLDNCEHLLDACAQLADALLRRCPSVHILATSREALGIAGEVSRRVPSLAVPDPDRTPSAGELAACEAARLFADRAAAVQPTFAVTGRNATAVAQICQRLDGIPLALELAAARLQGLAVEQLAARLDQQFRLLTGGSRAALPRQRTLRAAIDWSYDLLTDREQELFARLSVFAGGWTLEAAERVVGDGGAEGAGTAPLTPIHPAPLPSAHTPAPIARDDVLDLLTQLVKKSLVVFEGSDPFSPTPGTRNPASPPRYRLLEPLRQYAAEQLATHGESDEIHRCHAAYYLALVEAAETGPTQADLAANLTRLKVEHDNLRAAQRWAESEGDAELGVRLTEALSWLARALVEAYQGTVAASDYEMILARARRAGDKHRELDALLGLAQARYVLALDAQEAQAIESARSLFEEAHALALGMGDRPGMVRALVPSVWLVDFWPELEGQARVNCREALALSRDLGDEDLLLDSQLAAWWYLGQSEAEAQAIELQSRLEQRRDLARLNRLYYALMWANVYWGKYARAVECSDLGVELAHALGVPPVQYHSLKALALIQLGRYAEAQSALRHEVADAAHPFGGAMRDLVHGVYNAELGAFERAASTFRAVGEPAARLGRAWMQRWSQIGLAGALVRLGRVGEAKAIDASPSLKASAGCEIAAPDVRAEILVAEGAYAEACRHAEESARRAGRRERRPDLVVAREVQVRSLLGLDRAAEALALAEATIPTALEMGCLPMAWRLEAGRARALARLGESGAAKDARQAAAGVIEMLATAIDDVDLRDGFLAGAVAALPPAG